VTMFEMVREFHEKFGLHVQHHAIDFSHENDDEDVVKLYTLRDRLHKEEWKELQDAWEDENLVEYADAICDLIYVLCGTAVSFGIPLDKCFREVHLSNMSKVDEDGTVHRDEYGKVIKGDGFFQPNLRDIIYPKPQP